MDFFEQVWEVTKLIPEGRVTTYGAIAKYLGTARGARVVGWALNQSNMKADVPAHRVVNRVGMLSGAAHFGGEQMKVLLEAEGIEVKSNKVLKFKELFWDPVTELEV
ncbi:MGMT family protein [Sediminitomix flava]|uniref:Methylated-DNA-protein-cysteine methyltransferase-like protein n=1 Tax=Sediminitomix flava TaxID=379075 RepID=A0A315ZHU8_SEDFL|nr:MGMT family protein [Sediminitomix flava]PWJ44793.1 methylated-DNA-protein-cysteine methyltransferase-like protein [Sediminitomix flava]